MLQLVYVSTARQPITDDLLGAILSSSRRNNARDGVTGLLVAGRRRFLQALEGPEQAVMDAYGRIKTDARHHALVMLTGRPVEGRSFGDWSMAYRAAGDAPEEGSLYEIVDALTAPLADKSLRAHFLGFADTHGRAA
jgi:hypothetical protein